MPQQNKKNKPSKSAATDKTAKVQNCQVSVPSEIVAQCATKVKSDDRKRNWTLVVYPESAPENWRELLDDEHLEWVESPLHDKDVNADGSKKKPHWHIVLLFDGKKSYEQIKELADKLNAPSPKFVQSARAMVRYCAHLDNPEKAQYEVSKIVAHGGVDLAELLRPTASSRYEMIGEMIAYISEKHITEFIDFALMCQAEHSDDWFPLLCDSAAFIIGQVIKSNRHKPNGGGTSSLADIASQS